MNHKPGSVSKGWKPSSLPSISSRLFRRPSCSLPAA